MQTTPHRDLLPLIVEKAPVGSLHTVVSEMADRGVELSDRHALRLLDGFFGLPPLKGFDDVRDWSGSPLNPKVSKEFDRFSRTKRLRLFFAQNAKKGEKSFVVLSDRRGSVFWVVRETHGADDLAVAVQRFRDFIGKSVVIVPHGELQRELASVSIPNDVSVVDYAHGALPFVAPEPALAVASPHSHLDQLEAESIRIIREAIAVARKPGMLFSMGKDSMVMWTLAKKAFWPEPPPFPLAVIDTRWKFQDMYQFREYMAALPETDVIVHINPDAIAQDVNPFDFGSARHTEITKTQALKQVLEGNQFDFVFGGARRDEERSRAKERIFSVRNERHGWDPKTQRPELWNLYNGVLPKGQSMRVFPLSNWTELDIWRYIEREGIPVVPLYFSKVRPFVERDGALIMVDDERFALKPGEKIHLEAIRFRTLGCYPLTGGVRSHANSVADIIEELEKSRVSERSSRVIDFDPGASMEQKKKDGYF